MNNFDVIVRPVLTEKANSCMDSNKYMFFVSPKSDKACIKRSVEFIFNVKVTKVNILNVLGKAVKFKQVRGRKVNRKKAIVTLEKGYKIDLSGT